MKKTIPLSEKTQAIIYGSLLGDGSLAVSRGYVNARFQFRHSLKQKEYFFWKTEQLKEICSAKCVWRQGSRAKANGWGSIKLRFGSQALPVLSEISAVVNRQGRKTVRRKWLNRLTSLSLFVWWCDDGSLVSDTRHGVFCLDGFSPAEVKIVQRYLTRVWGIETKIFQVSQTKNHRLAIRSREELKKFLRIILPHLQIESMLYKFLLLYQQPDLQQRWISEIVDLTGFSKTQVEKVVRQRKQQLKNFRE